MTLSTGQPSRPSLARRVASALLMGLTGAISKGFIYGFNTVEVHGGDGFARVLKQRTDPHTRKRGLITVSNHICV
jgi:monolysocardiolipin acyltransferase